MNIAKRKGLISQAEYAKYLRPYLPKAAFEPNTSRLWLLWINVSILVMGWGMASQLDRWSPSLLWLFLPIAVVMGNSVIVLLFSSHDLMHSKALKTPLVRQLTTLLGMTMLWMPPSLWKALHNRTHHNKTNSLGDPDRNYLQSHPNNFGKWIQNLFAPSHNVNPLWTAIGMGYAWGIYTFRNLVSVLFYNDGTNSFAVAAFRVTEKERRAIAGELLAIVATHVGIMAFLSFDPLKLALGYFLPIWIGYAGCLFYIYTNHMLCRMTEVNDPLINSVSLRVPKILDVLHLNFSYHTEHHVFPGVNSDYYPQVQALLLEHFPGRFNLLPAMTAWRMMLTTPRHYKDEMTFTNWTGEQSVRCPLSEVAEG
ncbi:MAG: fatty acid desaturase [Cyanobacteria bacterium P01_E01_bin.45]